MAARKSYAGRAAADDQVVSGGRLTVGGIVAIAVDTVLNGGGMWAFVLNLDDTDSYAMLAKTLASSADSAAASAAGGEMRMLPALGIALGLGLVLSLAPHKLWKSAAGHEQQTRRRIAAVAAGLGGWVTTWLFITAVGITGPIGFVVSLVVEWLLFEFKREVLR